MARVLVTGGSYPTGESPTDLVGKQLSFQPGVVYDGKPWGQRFGDVIKDVPQAQFCWGETVTATFR